MSTPAPDLATDEPLVMTARHDGVLEITINRPDKRNALSRPTLAALAAAFGDNAHDTGVRAVVLTGAGDKSFAAGGDLKELDALRTVAQAAQMSREARTALDAIRAFPAPVVAVLNGDALGGGAELAIACDFRVMAPHARIGFVQGRMGITTAWGGGIDLISLLGAQVALRLTCTAQVLDAEAARAIGLVDEIAPPGATARAAASILLSPMLTQPRAVLAAFKALNRAARAGLPRTALEAMETDRFADVWVAEDHWAAVAAFNARKKP